MTRPVWDIVLHATVTPAVPIADQEPRFDDAGPAGPGQQLGRPGQELDVIATGREPRGDAVHQIESGMSANQTQIGVELHHHGSYATSIVLFAGSYLPGGAMTFSSAPLPRPRRAVLALIALSAAAFCFVTTEILPIGLLTVMASDLHRSESTAGLLVTGYATVVLVASVPLVWLTQRVARRRLLVGTLAVFTAATTLSSVAADFGVLLGARLFTALAQALFWSVVASAATALFSPAVRGRVVARLAIGSALAPVLGVPAGVWLGQQAGWRAPFVVMAGAGALAGVVLLAVLPSDDRRQDPTGGGATPDARRYLQVLMVTALAVTGVMGTFTYITPFLVEVGGFAPTALGALLLVAGITGVVGTWSMGTILDRHPGRALVLPLVTLASTLAALAMFGTVKAVAVAGLATLGLGFNALAPAIQGRTLDVAPGGVDLAVAGTSAVFNAGIAAGSFLGGLLLAGPGVRAIPAAALVFVTAALVVAALKVGPVRARDSRHSTAGVDPARALPSPARPSFSASMPMTAMSRGHASPAVLIPCRTTKPTSS
jgi:DHA1 family L-arabinose/isopropyl-beta-D-thiogalactopyranoside export protein-like MFS transporter/DHA1 family inner membrane transport protein